VLGPYGLQAAIAATHADAATASETNWPQVHALYLILDRIAANPMVTLNRAIALAETEGPQAGLALLATLDGDERMAAHHWLLSVRAHLLEQAGDTAGAYQQYSRAAKTTASLAERRYLESRARRVRPLRPGPAAELLAQPGDVGRAEPVAGEHAVGHPVQLPAGIGEVAVRQPGIQPFREVD
jgi:predicted RNA polymerase sigma factor